MGTERSGGQIRAKVELRGEEDDPEEQSDDTDSMRLSKHSSKTELRPERLRGQANRGPESKLLATESAFGESNGLHLNRA